MNERGREGKRKGGRGGGGEGGGGEREREILRSAKEAETHF